MANITSANITTALAVWGAVLSTLLALGKLVAHVNAHRVRVRVRVEGAMMSTLMPFGGIANHRPTIRITITNRSAFPVTVQSIILQNGKAGNIGVENWDDGEGKNLRIPPHESVNHDVEESWLLDKKESVRAIVILVDGSQFASGRVFAMGLSPEVREQIASGTMT